jgi:hypothetical protein
VDYWLATTASGASLMTLQAKNVMAKGVAPGMGQFGSIFYLRDLAVGGSKGLAQVTPLDNNNQYNQN